MNFLHHVLSTSLFFGVGLVDLDENMANTGLRKKKKKNGLTKLAPLLKDGISDPC